MKKALIIGTLVIAILLVSSIFIMMQSQPVQKAAIGEKEAQWAIREVLKERAESSLDTLVMGTLIDDKKWDFRGVNREGESGVPIYGVIHLTCNKPRKKIECWKLETLNKNGRDWRLNINVDDSEKPKIITLGKVKKDNNKKTEEVNKSSKIQEKVNTIWRVKGNSVNGRVGPGTGFKISAKINPEIELELLEKSKGWGKFSFTSSDGNKKTVWIWMDLTEKPKL